MKKIYCLLSWLLPVSSFAQCPTGNLLFSSQASIDAFAPAHPGCTAIAGSLTISGADITDLSPLGSITSVAGSFYLSENDALTSTGGLNIASIGDTLSVDDNPQLTSLSGFSHLTTLGGGLIVSTNRKLPALSGLHQITSVGGDVVIEFQEICTSLAGLEGLTSIGGGLMIYSNEQLSGVAALDNLTSVTGGIEIEDCPALTSISGFNNISASIRNLVVRNNVNLLTISGFQGITSIAGITENGTTEGGKLEIIGNRVLTSVTGLDNLTEVSHQISITDNTVLTSISGFSSVERTGQITIYSNNLSNLNELVNLEEVSGQLNIGSNPNLTALGMPGLLTVGSLSVNNNPLLAGLDLPALETIKEDLYLGDNNALLSLAGLSRLNTLGNLTIIFNRQLSFCAIRPVCALVSQPHEAEYSIFANGEYCDSEAAVVSHCAALPVTLVSFEAKNSEKSVTLSWVTASEENSESFEIQRLAPEGKWQTIGVLTAQGTVYEATSYHFIDPAPVMGNNLYRLKMIDTDGTFSYSQIRNIRITGRDFTGIYPNPVTDKLYLADPAFGSDARIRVFDQSGKMVMHDPAGTQQGTRILDASQLPAGVYIIQSDRPGAANARFLKN